MSTESAEWLLSNEAAKPEYKTAKITLKRITSSNTSKFVTWGFFIILAVLNVVQYLESITASIPSQMVYSPVQYLLSYELRYFGTGKQDGPSPDPSPYLGEPSPELDKAWFDLYPSVYQLIPKETAAKLSHKTLIFPHDPERRYVVELDVFHQLHCLNMIRKSIRPDYYKPFAPGMVNNHSEDLLFGPDHVNHCIENIRQALMCHVDVTPYTWLWNSTTGRMQNSFATPHTCRNFDVVREWARPERNGGNVSLGFDAGFRELNDPLDRSTWVDGYRGD